MTCPTCARELQPDHAFCPGCGTRRPGVTTDDDEIALFILNVWMEEGAEYKSFDDMVSTDQHAARAMLAKARELLCTPLEAEIARLRAALAAARKDAANALRELSESCRMLSKLGNSVLDHLRQTGCHDTDNLSGYAREAERYALAIYKVASWVVTAFERDASQTVEEPKACDHPEHMREGSAGSDGKVSSRCTSCGKVLYKYVAGVHGIADEQRPADAVRIIDNLVFAIRDHMRQTGCGETDNIGSFIAEAEKLSREMLADEQRPAVDVEGLAKVLDYVLEMRSHLADDQERTKVARDLAETAIDYIAKHGGNR